MIDSIFPLINEKFRREAAVLLTQYVGIRCLSPAFDPEWVSSGEIERALLLFTTWANERSIPGIKTSISKLVGRTPALVIEIPSSDPESDKSDSTVLIYGHLDKQPAVGPWANNTDPFVAEVSDDQILGRGTVDDGYAIVAALTGIEALSEQNEPYPRCVVVIEASEESGSPDLDAHIESLIDVLGNVALVICLDSGGLDFKRLWVTTSLRGNLVMTINVEVLGHGVHSGEAGGVVPSSFMILRQLLSRIEDADTGKIMPSFLHSEVPQYYRNHAKILDSMFYDPLDRAFPKTNDLKLLGESGSERILNQTWSPSLEVTGMNGIPDVGVGGNVLRPFTLAKISLRLPPNVDAQRAQRSLIELLEADPPFGSKVTISPETPANGWVAPVPKPWLGRALEDSSNDGFGAPAGFCGVGGSIPFLATLGARFPNAQIVATGALGPGSNAHGPDESLQLSPGVGVAVAVARLVIAVARERLTL